MVARFTSGILQEPNLDEVPDEGEFLSQPNNISTCNDKAQLINAIGSFPERFGMGYNIETVTLEYKSDLLNAYVKG